MKFHRGARVALTPTPDAPNPDEPSEVRKWVRAQVGPTAIDLFSGAGGLSLGLKMAGFSVLVGADHDAFALETHVANIGGLGYGADLGRPDAFLKRLQEWGIRKVDLVAAGLPCQPFSQAGRAKIRSLVRAGERDGDDPRVTMWRSFTTIVEALRPRAVLIENVPELAVWQDGALIMELCDRLHGLGYRTEARVLRASNYGVPQHRRRLFIVGLRPGLQFGWPEPRRWRATIRAAISDLPAVGPEQRSEALAYGGPLTSYQRLMRRGLVGRPGLVVRDHVTRAVRADDARAFRLMREGDTYMDLPRELQRYRRDIFDDKYKRLTWDEPSRSITAHLAKDGYWYIHPGQHRTLSVREAARIQSFPDRFRFAGTPMHRYRQIGNAVPPLLAEAIGRQLVATLAAPARGGRHPRRDEFRTRLLEWHAEHGRTFPWRERRAGAWRVLLAEICLHRTRADQVAPVYRRLVRLAPTPEALLEHAAEVRRLVRQLGLHWRGRNVVRLARSLVRAHSGRVPRTYAELKSLPGVGEYVARAVQSFALGQPSVILDTNTQRIIGRVRMREGTHRWQTRLDLYELAGTRGPDAAFNYALLDLGALVCRPTRLKCEECPVRDLCQTRLARSA